ncbi:putative L-galactonate transporter [Anaerolineae bacterium]|nr:putative L-galactonate transporter [Anaerolineae bacterium]
MPHPKYTTRYLVILTILLMLVSIVNIADKELLAPVAEVVRADLGMSDTQLGAVRSAVFLAALVSQLYWGPLSDRWVRKNVITLGTIVWSALTWLTAFVANFPQLLAARASMSFAEGCFNPSSFALITDSVPKRHHGLVIGLMSLTYPVGTAAALIVASAIGTAQWRQPFVIYGVIGIALGALVFLFVREPMRGASEEAVEAGAYLGRFSFAEMRRVWTTPSALLGFALDTCQATINWSLAFWAPIYFTRYRIAPNADAAALALLPAILGFVLGALIGGAAIDRLRAHTERAAAIIALIAMAGGLVAAFITFNLFEMTAVMIAGFVLGLVGYMAMPAVNIVFFSVVPPETKASTIATSNVILNLVIAIISFLIGVISDAAELRFAFSGVVLMMFAIGIGVSLGLLRTLPGDMMKQRKLVEARVNIRERSST